MSAALLLSRADYSTECIFNYTLQSQVFSKRAIGYGVCVRVGVTLTRWLCPRSSEPPSAHIPHRTILHPLAPAAVTAPSNYPTWPFQCYCVARNLFNCISQITGIAFIHSFMSGSHCGTGIATLSPCHRIGNDKRVGQFCNEMSKFSMS